MVQEGRFAVNIDGGAHFGGDSLDIHILGIQATILIIEEVHRSDFSYSNVL